MPPWPTDLSLQHPKLVAQRQHLGAELAVAATADDQDLDKDLHQVVEKGVEQDRGSIPGLAL